jgi:predicted Fe-Mo cluster-binding NifX family protein
MKIALAVWKNRISPVFDSSRTVLLAHEEKGHITGRRCLALQSETPYDRAVELFELGINVLICGAISKTFSTSIESRGIEIIPFITGEVDGVIESYLAGSLHHCRFSMPGCGPRNRRRFRGASPIEH